MPALRNPAWLAAAAIAVLAVATGPVVGFVQVPDPGPADLGTGHADVEIRSLPDRASLSAGTYTDVHELAVPPIHANLGTVTGAPTVTASIRIPELGFGRSSVFSLGGVSAGERSFTISPTTIESDRIHEESYRGRLRLVLRERSGETVLADRRIRITVAA
jgi:hypothetical protein